MRVRFFNRINFNTLAGFGSHYGPLVSDSRWDVKCSAYVHSRINDRFFINLTITTFSLTSSLKFLSFCGSRKLYTLFFFKAGFLKFVRKARFSTAFWKKNAFVVSKWLPGILTNYGSLRHKVAIHPFMNIHRFPNLVVFLDSNRFWDVVSKEARVTRLPSVGLSDLDMGYSPFSYTIPSNNKSFGTLYAYYKFFFFAIRRGYAASNYLSTKKGFAKIVKLWNLWFYLQCIPTKFFAESSELSFKLKLTSVNKGNKSAKKGSFDKRRSNIRAFTAYKFNSGFYFPSGFRNIRDLIIFLNSFSFFVLNRSYQLAFNNFKAIIKHIVSKKKKVKKFRSLDGVNKSKGVKRGRGA